MGVLGQRLEAKINMMLVFVLLLCFEMMVRVKTLSM